MFEILTSVSGSVGLFLVVSEFVKGKNVVRILPLAQGLILLSYL
jgi:hypothetical protein